MSEYTRAQILENRRKWIDFLQLPDTKKGTGRLEDSVDNSARCCLGHACHLFVSETRKIGYYENIYYGNDRSYAPVAVVEKLGLFDYKGSTAGGHDKIFVGVYRALTLAEINDDTRASPQEIGAYLETVIEGGDNTPFKPLTDYPE